MSVSSQLKRRRCGGSEASAYRPKSYSHVLRHLKKFDAACFANRRFLIHGTFADVWLARFEPIEYSESSSSSTRQSRRQQQRPLGNEKCVLKMFDKASKMGVQVQNEVDILSRVQHPHIIALYGWGENSTHVFLVFEYAARGDLFDLTAEREARNKDLSFRRACKYLHQLTLAIDYLHSKNIVHGDIKPENILIDDDNNVKLADFGAAVDLTDKNLSRNFHIGGTFEFMAPEILFHAIIRDSRNKHKKRSASYYTLTLTPGLDMWSLGMVMYELWAHALPFFDKRGTNDRKDLKRAYRKMADRPGASNWLEYSSRIDPLACDLIGRLLMWQPECRYSSDEALQHGLFKQER